MKLLKNRRINCQVIYKINFFANKVATVLDKKSSQLFHVKIDYFSHRKSAPQIHFIGQFSNCLTNETGFPHL